MRKNRTNIAILALFQLVIFLTPVGIKSFHRHHAGEEHILNKGIQAVSKCEDKCVICQFDYLNFIISSKPDISPVVLSVYSFSPATAHFLISEPFIYFQHRAPPSVA